MVAANLPDLDVLSFLSDTPAVALRRGWTHGVLAQALLPVALTAFFVFLDRRRPDPDGNRVAPAAMLGLGYVGVLSHVAMDWLNNYGVRLLMPFSNQWFYGDVLFIIDVWLWLILGGGVWLAIRWSSSRPARLALIVATAYIVAMTWSARMARDRVVTAWSAAKGGPPAGVMVGPVPVTPFTRRVIIDAGDHYEQGTLAWRPLRVRFDPQHVQKNDRHPASVHAAQIDPDFRAVLLWARFPYYSLTRIDNSTRVNLSDLRFPPTRLFEVSTVVPDQ